MYSLHVEHCFSMLATLPGFPELGNVASLLLAELTH
jgi:hypothetical protein